MAGNIWESQGGPGSGSFYSPANYTYGNLYPSVPGSPIYDSMGNRTGFTPAGSPYPTAGGGLNAPGMTGANQDPQSAAAMSFLQDVMSGKQQPYDQASQAADLTHASDMNASAETARNGLMTNNALAGGASATDPSLAGARMSSMARRQSDNATAANSIAQNANRTNFGAKMDAAGTMANYGLAQQDRLRDAQKAAAATSYSTAPTLSGNASPYPAQNGQRPTAQAYSYSGMFGQRPQTQDNGSGVDQYGNAVGMTSTNGRINKRY